MKFGSAGPLTRPGRQLAGFLILSLGAHDHRLPIERKAEA